MFEQRKTQTTAREKLLPRNACTQTVLLQDFLVDIFLGKRQVRGAFTSAKDEEARVID